MYKDYIGTASFYMYDEWLNCVGLKTTYWSNIGPDSSSRQSNSCLHEHCVPPRDSLNRDTDINKKRYKVLVDIIRTRP